MNPAVRIALSALALILGTLAAFRETHDLPGTAFSIPKTSPSSLDETQKPVCREEMINLEQDLPFTHVASVIELGNGALAALWYGGPYEYCHDNKIYLSKKRNGGWSPPSVVMTTEQAERDLDRPLKTLGNPLICRNPDGSLRLIFITIAMGKWSASELNSCLSNDHGKTWSRVERLTLSPLCNFSELVRNRPVPLMNGGFCIPVYQELIGKFPELLWLRERDGSLEITKTRIAGGCSTLQPSLVPLDEKRAVVLLRDWTKAKRVFFSRSEDSGVTWTKPSPTDLPNPDAAVSGLLLPGDRVLVAYNDSPSDRNNLSLAISSGGNLRWKKLTQIENDPSESFFYPYLMQSSDGVIHVVYTWHVDGIKMVSFTDAWIRDLEMKKVMNP
jgi:predicted neuraminidase